MDPDQSREAAERVLVEMAETLLAFVQPEAQARAADQPWPGFPRVIQPHILLPRLHKLVYFNRLGRTKAATRGGRSVNVYHPFDLSNRRRAVEDLAARKRLLYSRYLTWAHGTDPAVKGGIIGEAAERIVHHCLRHASPTVGYRLENPDGGRAAVVLDEPVPAGPLDNAAHVHIGNPPKRYILVFEVKSYRSWVYHESHDQLYQVLYKAAALQHQLPSESIVPVLVCRKAHLTAYRMVKDLGGYIIQTARQWVLPQARAHVSDQAVGEINAELNFDLHVAPANFIDARVLKQVTTFLPDQIERQAERWRLAGSRFEQEYYDLWQSEFLRPLATIRGEMKAAQYAWVEGGW